MQTIQISGLNRTVALVSLTYIIRCRHSAVNKDPGFFTFYYIILVQASILKIVSWSRTAGQPPTIMCTFQAGRIRKGEC